jgi:hypothetical protein
MQIIKATGLHRKPGGAQWRDLRFNGPFLEMFFDRNEAYGRANDDSLRSL